MRYLVFDDDKERQEWFLKELEGHEVVQAWDVPQALKALEGPRFDFAFLDHDIVDVKKTRVREVDGHVYYLPGWASKDGMDLVKAILNMPPDRRPKAFHVHSWNLVAAKEMEAKLKEAGLVVSRAPYGQFKLKLQAESVEMVG